MLHDVKVVSTKLERGQPPKWQAVCYTENLALGDPQDDYNEAARLKNEHLDDVSGNNG
jgi:hypothetical protein